jgi:ABC-type multidrug transport system permease subunit
VNLDWRIAWLIGWKDCLVRFQSRAVLAFVVALPLAMTAVTGLAFKGFEPQTVRLDVAVVQEDETLPPAAVAALQRFQQMGHESPEPGDQPPKDDGTKVIAHKDLTAKDAEDQVKDRKLHGAIIFPKGFAENFGPAQKKGETPAVKFVLHSDRTLERAMLQVAFDRLMVDLQTGGQAGAVKAVPDSVGTATKFSSFSQAVTGNGVMFILLNCITAAGISLVRERRQNTLARMLIAPLSRSTVVLGKTMGVFLVGVIQAVVVFGFGAFVIDMPARSIPGIALVTLLLILVGCALGLTVSALCRREETVEAVGLPLALLLTAMGGGMFPFHKAPEWMQFVAQLLPTGHAMTAYHALLREQKGLAHIWPNLLVLAAFAAVFFAIGVRKLRWE